MSDDVPDWSLARSQPLRFFNLESGASRVELRRRYASLIRKYKPETHSAEFQIIRAAFEAGERLLREDASEVVRRPGRETRDEKPADCAGDVEPIVQSAFASRPISEPLQNQVASQPGSVSQQEPGERLLQAAREVHSDRFYYEFCEDLRLFIAGTNFNEWSELLRKLALYVDDNDYRNLPYGKTHFLIQVLPYAIWTAPEEWVAEHLEFLNENADLVMDDDSYDLLLRVIHYKENFPREDYPELREVFMPLHRCIVAFFAQPQGDALQFVVATQAELESPGHWFDQVVERRWHNAIRLQLEIWHRILRWANQQLIGSNSIEHEFAFNYRSFLDECLKPFRQTETYLRLRERSKFHSMASQSFMLFMSAVAGFFLAYTLNAFRLPLLDRTLPGHFTWLTKQRSTSLIGVSLSLLLAGWGLRALRTDYMRYEKQLLLDPGIDWKAVLSERVRSDIVRYLRKFPVSWVQLRIAFEDRSKETASVLSIPEECVSELYQIIMNDQFLRCCCMASTLRAAVSRIQAD